MACIAQLCRAGIRPPAAAVILDGGAPPDAVTIHVDIARIREHVREALAAYPIVRVWT